MTRVALYRYFDAEGRLLYVGASASPMRRNFQHQDSKPWFSQVASATFQWFPDWDSAYAAEAQAIAAENPLHNISQSRSGPPRGKPQAPTYANDTPLARWLLRSRVTQAELASILGVARVTVSKYASGGCVPTEDRAKTIETVTGGAVPVDSWPKRPRKAAPSAAMGLLPLMAAE